MIELGLAIAWRKPLFLFRGDFRRCTDSEDHPLNLMLFTGYSAEGWWACWYDSVAEIADPGKGRVRWLRGEDVTPVDPAAGFHGRGPRPAA